jgi:hypothetical protein
MLAPVSWFIGALLSPDRESQTALRAAAVGT